jgi:dienelactone hydrolase
MWRKGMRQLALMFGAAAAIAMPADARTIGQPAGTGRWPAIAEERADFPGYTVYRPLKLPEQPMPVVLWGNGGCRDNGLSAGHFLREIASHGYLVIANGKSGEETPALAKLPPPPAPGTPPPPPPPPARVEDETSVKGLLAAIDLAVRANVAGDLRGRVDASRVAATGHSCGGLQAIAAAADPRVGAVIAFNSGVYNRTGNGLSGVPVTKDDLRKIHTPIAYVLGGPTDIAWPNGSDDFARIDHVPVMLASLPVGHGGTFALVNGGDWARFGALWLDWQLKRDGDAARWFTGDDCRFCTSYGWDVQRKQFPAQP